MRVCGQDTLEVRRSLDVDGARFDYFSLPEAAKQLGDLSRLPFSLKVLLENLLRFEDGRTVTVDHIKALRPGWSSGAPTRRSPIGPPAC